MKTHFLERWGTTLGMLTAFLLGAALCGSWINARAQADMAQLKTAHAQQVADARQADIDALTAAQVRADSLTLRVQQVQTEVVQKTKEVTDALHAQTTGRACLSAGAVRVLNAAIATDAAAHLPAPATSAASANEPIATDADVASWANTAREQYVVCRARLDALIDFSETSFLGIQHSHD